MGNEFLMKKLFKKAFIPHIDNNFAPHLFREAGVVAVIALTLVVFAAGELGKNYLATNERMLAAVYPSVVVELTNKDRQDATLGTLRVSPLLEQAARLKAEDMVAKGYFAHVSPEGLDPWHWIHQVGYSYHYAGENLAINFNDSSDVTTAWMNSPTHRANLLNKDFTEIGVATVSGVIDGKQTVFVVQMFGTPKTAVATPISTAVIATTTKTTTLAAATVATTSPIKVSASTTATLIASAPTSTVLGTETVATSDAAMTIAPESVTPKNPLLAAVSPIVSNPRHATENVYIILLILVILAFVLFLFYAKKHHIKHIYYGIFIIVWLAICVLLYCSFISSNVIVI